MPWHRRLAAFAVAALCRVCLKTWRVRRPESGNFQDSKGPVIFCVWHNRFLPVLATYNAFAHLYWPAKGMATMISASRDGSLVANIAERFGIQAIRGSTSRRGPQALLEATTWLERGYSIAMFSDGPRGPVYHVKEGIIALAKLTGYPIVPASNFTSWKITLRSWDGFQIPLPFAACEAYFGEPIWVPREATENEREQLRVQLETAMRAITRD